MLCSLISRMSHFINVQQLPSWLFCVCGFLCYFFLNMWHVFPSFLEQLCNKLIVLTEKGKPWFFALLLVIIMSPIFIHVS